MKRWKEMAQTVRSKSAETGLGPGVTLMEVLGTGRILVEHHRGILGYGTEQIHIGASFGIIVIEGLDLRLCCMSRSQLFVAGNIRCIRLEGRNC